MNCIKQRMLYACQQTYRPDVQLPGREVGWIGGFTRVDPPEQPGDGNIDFALVGRIPEGILVAIRGTLPPIGSGHPFEEVVGDWINNVDLRAGSADYPGQVHAGFARSADRLWPLIESAVRERIGPEHNRLFVTGHSKGGAVANLVAWRALGLAGVEGTIRVYTVAAARAGNEAFRDRFERERRLRCVRYESALDIVPYLPLGADTPRWARTLATSLWPGLLDHAYVSVGSRLPPGISWQDRIRAWARAANLAMLDPRPESYLRALGSAHDIDAGSGYDSLICPGEEGCAHDRG